MDTDCAGHHMVRIVCQQRTHVFANIASVFPCKKDEDVSVEVNVRLRERFR